MAKPNKVLPKKTRGPPATSRNPVTAIRLPEELRRKVDAWASSQSDQPGRSEAIRRLVALSLARVPRVRGNKSAKANAAESSKIAARQIDRMGDQAATSEERASRKQRLLKGPKEFRDLRGDAAKAKL